VEAIAMKQLLVSILAVLAVALAANTTTAGGYWTMHPWMPPYYVHYEPQKAIAWRPETHFREVEAIVQEPTYKTVTKQYMLTVMVEDFRNEEHTGTFYKYVPRTFEIDVQRVRLVPTKVASPCGHCILTIGVPELYTQRQQHIAMDRVAKQRKWIVRVPF